MRWKHIILEYGFLKLIRDPSENRIRIRPKYPDPDPQPSTIRNHLGNEVESFKDKWRAGGSSVAAASGRGSRVKGRAIFVDIQLPPTSTVRT